MKLLGSAQSAYDRFHRSRSEGAGPSPADISEKPSPSPELLITFELLFHSGSIDWSQLDLFQCQTMLPCVFPHRDDLGGLGGPPYGKF